MSKVSIIAPSKNQGEFLGQWFNSIENATTKSATIVVSDCLSTDGTQEFFKKKICKNDRFNIVYTSTEDSGVSSALNAALKNVGDSEIIGWLNTDDYYSPGAIDRALSLFKKNPNLLFIYGRARQVDLFGCDIGPYPVIGSNAKFKNFETGNFICQPTIFFRKRVLKEVGLFDESFKTAFDYDFFVKIFQKYPTSKIGFINRVQAYSRLHNLCITKKYRQQVAIEGLRIVSRYFINSGLAWALTYIDECCKGYPFLNDDRSLTAVIYDFAHEAKEFLSKIELDQLNKLIKDDSRLKFSTDNVYLSVEPDGWSGRSLDVRLRYTKHTRYVRIRCRGGWPFLRQLRLKIIPQKGEPQYFYPDSKEEFNLILEAPDCDGENFFFWSIESSTFFIPKDDCRNSLDTRKLCFHVDGVDVSDNFNFEIKLN